MRHVWNILHVLRKLLFKSVAVTLGLGLLLAIFWYDASLLNLAADFNLDLIKRTTKELPKGWGSKTESALRIGLSADKALILLEATAVAKLILLGIAGIFRLRAAAWRAARGNE